MDPRRFSLDSMPQEERAAAILAKATALHDMACRFQDELNHVGVFLGDEPPLQAKKRIDDACTKARRVCDRIRHARSVPG